MSNSKLATSHYWTENYSSRNGAKIEKIIIHHMAGALDAKGCYNVWKTREASAHYCIDKYGNIGQTVDEKYRTWSVANAYWDSRSVTIECANSKGSPNWEISDATMKALIKLVADIAQRNDIKVVYTGDTSGTLLMHKWFMSTSCPGPYLSKKFSYIAGEANKLLNANKSTTKTVYRVRKTWEDKNSQVGAYTDVANAKKMADSKGLNVYDDKGKLVYSGKKTTTTNTTTKKTEVKSVKKTVLAVDGVFGTNSIKRAQEVFGTTKDGIISGQIAGLYVYYTSIPQANIRFDGGTGSALVKAIQKAVGATQDGTLGPQTIKKLQKALGITQDGYWGPATSKAFQKWLNTK